MRTFVTRNGRLVVAFGVLLAACAQGSRSDSASSPSSANERVLAVDATVDEASLPPAVQTLAEADPDLLWNVVRGVVGEFGYREVERAEGLITTKLFRWTEAGSPVPNHGSLAVRMTPESPGSRNMKVAVWCYRFEGRDAAGRPVLSGEPESFVLTGNHKPQQDNVARQIYEQYLAHSTGVFQPQSR